MRNFKMSYSCTTFPSSRSPSSGTGSAGTDPGITNSTTGNGGVDLNSGRGSIPAASIRICGLRPVAPVRPGTDEDKSSLGEACPQ